MSVAFKQEKLFQSDHEMRFYKLASFFFSTEGFPLLLWSENTYDIYSVL